MQLKVLLPTGPLLNIPIQKITFEGLDGWQTFLPHHCDYMTIFKTGIATYWAGKNPQYIACTSGVCQKQGDNVVMTTHLALLGDDLKTLTAQIEERFRNMEEERKAMQATFAHLELNLNRGLINLNKQEEYAL